MLKDLIIISYGISINVVYDKKNAKWKNSEFPFCSYTIRLKAHMTDGYEMRGAIYMEGPLLIESIWKTIWKVSF